MADQDKRNKGEFMDTTRRNFLATSAGALIGAGLASNLLVAFAVLANPINMREKENRSE